MDIKYWTHEGVKPDGTFEDRLGAIGTEPKIDATWSGEGCDCGTCGGADTYIRVNLGRDDEGTVRGMTIYFDSDEEMKSYLDNKNFLH